MIEIEQEDLLQLIHWARRYCDGKCTFDPYEFNSMYRKLRQLNPNLMDADKIDNRLSDDGMQWPYAVEGMAQFCSNGYNPFNNVGWDAKERVVNG